MPKYVKKEKDIKKVEVEVLCEYEVPITLNDKEAEEWIKINMPEYKELSVKVVKYV